MLVGPAMIENVERYILSRELSSAYAQALRHRVHAFLCWTGRPLRVDELDDDLLNRWIASLEAQNLKPRTRRHYRAAVLTIWRDAYNRRQTDHRPERIRPVRVPLDPPVAWTLPEVQRLLAACAHLPGRVARTDVARSTWFDRLIRLAWTTGFRLADLLRLEAHQIDPAGIVRIAQSKTARPLAVKIPAELSQTLPTAGPLLPWPGCSRQFPRWFGRLVKIAGIRPGTFRFLRRSAASYVERDHPGAARAFLGHATPGLAERHYLDPSIVGRIPPSPPPLST